MKALHVTIRIIEVAVWVFTVMVIIAAIRDPEFTARISVVVFVPAALITAFGEWIISKTGGETDHPVAN